MAAAASHADGGADVRFGTPAGRWVLLATVLGSGLAALDATVVNVALPAIGEDLGAQVAGLQWVITAYLLTLASLILLGGALGDRYGRRKVFCIGVIWFTAASLLCGAAPNLEVLIGARALQGIGGALLTPGSLAIIEATFVPVDRSRAIGAWSGLGGIANAIGPLAGGLLISAGSWQMIFLLNLPFAAVVLWASRHVPETRDPRSTGRLDLAGAVLGIVGLGGVTYALIEAPAGVGRPSVLAAAVVGVFGVVGFFIAERRSAAPMLPLGLFSSRQFSAANLVTAALYAALAGIFFLLAVDLQQVLGYSPLEAGAALLPLTLVMLAFSARAGALAQRIGPRIPMTVGPVIVGAGLLLMLRIDPSASYASHVLPAVLVFGCGLALTVAPLTATVLAAVDAGHAGIASGVNNAVARVAGLLAIAVLPSLSGLTGTAYEDPVAFNDGFHTATLICAALVSVAAAIAWFGIRNDALASSCVRDRSCAVDAPPLRLAVE